jgi:lipopolysaccharide export system permease protein
MIVLVILVIDFVEKNDDFIQNKAPFRSIIISYYLNLAPYWANYVSPLMIFISTVFFTARLASHTEIIAILSSGVSYLRLMRPYFMGAMLVGFFTFGLIGWVIPRANKVRIEFENKFIKENYSFSQRDIHMGVAPNVYIYMSSYNNESNIAYDVTLEKIVKNRLLEKLHAERVEWNDTLKKWSIKNYTIRKLGVVKDEIKSGTTLDSLLNMTPSDFSNDNSMYETFTLPELKKRIALLESRGSEGIESYQIEWYQRFANPFAVVILSIIGLIISSRKARGGIGVQIALGFLLAFTYMMFFILSKGIAESGSMTPLLAVWLPNIIFTGIGIILYYFVPK